MIDTTEKAQNMSNAQPENDNESMVSQKGIAHHSAVINQHLQLERATLSMANYRNLFPEIVAQSAKFRAVHG